MTNAQRTRAKNAARLFKLIASPTRVSLLSVLLKHKELAVQDISDELRMTHSAVSHQLSLLSDAGIVTSRKDGRMMFYRISGKPEARSLVQFLKTFKI